MAKVVLNTSIQLRNDTEANWNKNSSFIPKSGEVVVYLADETHTTPRLKVGNGRTTIVDLPFVNSEGIDLSNIVAQKVSHKLIFGNGQVYEYDGSEEVRVPVYTGN